jgi:hypothetical protein
MWIFKKFECAYVHWINVAQDRTHWRAVVGTVMNMFHKILEFLTS